MILTDDNISFIRFAKDIMDKGRYCDTAKLTEVYNECFADRPNFKPVKNTNCGSCLRHRIGELYFEMQKVLTAVETKTEEKKEEV